MADYNEKLGHNLRTVRHMAHLSLHDVGEKTDGEFKASVVGAYERGGRAITAVRLHELCEFYGVTPSDVLPR